MPSTKKSSSAETLSPEEEAQKKDEQYLAQNATDIEEVMQLIEERVTRDTAHLEVEKHKAHLAFMQDPSTDPELRGLTAVFHEHKPGRKIPIRGRTSKMLHLSAALEKHLTTLRHGKDLARTLEGLVDRRIKTLERVRERGLF